MKDRRSSLVLDLRPGERLSLAGIVSVELVKKSGQLSRLRVTAPPEVRIEKERAPHGKESVPSMAQ